MGETEHCLNEGLSVSELRNWRGQGAKTGSLRTANYVISRQKKALHNGILLQANMPLPKAII